MGNSSRTKGARGERELAAQLNAYGFDAVKVSAAYQEGHDVEALYGRLIEVKRYHRLPCKTWTNWLRDAHIVAMREDRGEWLVAMDLATLADILDEHAAVAVEAFADEHGIRI